MITFYCIGCVLAFFIAMYELWKYRNDDSSEFLTMFPIMVLFSWGTVFVTLYAFIKNNMK